MSLNCRQGLADYAEAHGSRAIQRSIPSNYMRNRLTKRFATGTGIGIGTGSLCVVGRGWGRGLLIVWQMTSFAYCVRFVCRQIAVPIYRSTRLSAFLGQSTTMTITSDADIEGFIYTYTYIERFMYTPRLRSWAAELDKLY